MLSDAIASLGTQAYTLTHRAVAGYDGHGRVVPPTTTASTTTGMIQALGGREIERLEEGLHARELRAYFTTDTLVVADHDQNIDGDHVTDNATPPVTWEVVKWEDWTALGGFNRYILSRVDP